MLTNIMKYTWEILQEGTFMVTVINSVYNIIGQPPQVIVIVREKFRKVYSLKLNRTKFYLKTVYERAIVSQQIRMKCFITTP